MNRWTLLKHEKTINEILDVHYDFLLENGQDCKTWKLINLPKLDGPSSSGKISNFQVLQSSPFSSKKS